jgi:hypothetical protein
MGAYFGRFKLQNKGHVKLGCWILQLKSLSAPRKQKDRFMSWILSIGTNLYGYIVAFVSAIAALLLLRESIKKGERDKIEQKAEVKDAEMREKALRNRVKNEKDFNKLSVDGKRDKLRKYSRPDDK